MNDRIAILRKAITAVTQSLSGTSVKVTQSGLDAYVKADSSGKPIHVNLPYVPDNADETLIDAIQGFLDHEVAHILFTDFTASKAVRDKGLKNLINILEDARIEKAMADKYRGCGANLRNTGEFFLENIVKPDFEKCMDEKASQEEFIGTLMTPLLRGFSGQSLFKDFMSDKITHVQDIYDKLKDLEPEIEALSSTEEVVNMATTIMRRIKEEPPEDGGSGGGDDESEEPSGSGCSDDDSGKGDDEEGGGDVGGVSGGSAEDESEKDESEKPKEESAGDVKGSEAEKNTDSKVSNVNPARAIEEIDKNSANSYDSALSRKMGEQVAMAAKGSDYLVYTQDSDRVEKLKVGSEFRPSMVKEMTDKVDAMVGPMSKDLERAMIARSKSVWEGGLRRGKLNSSSLARLATRDDRVFRTKHESTTNDVAVSLVVDASGSMYGSKIHTAALSAYALSSVLDRLKITNEVICFTTCGQPDASKIKEQESKYGVRYSRTEALYMPILKGYQERVATETKQRFAWLPKASFLANNVDGECVEIAFRRLMQRKEKGKIMIVLSDGSPSAHGDSSRLSRHLKDTVTKIEATGTKVIGIGIQSDAVKRYYKKTIIVNEVEELPKGVIRELRAMLLANN
jgi:cobaltochelatase CobT